MTSIIVLDSSSDEDEAPPPKKVAVPESISTTITIVDANKTTMKTSTKARTIPSGISVTARAVTGNNPNTNNNTVPNRANNHQQASPMPKINAAYSLKDVQLTKSTTASPAGSTTMPSKKQSQQVVMPQLPQLQPAPQIRKRKTPTPPYQQQQQHQFQSSKPCTPSLIPPSLMPMITSVQSFAAADAVPPLQLLATPTNSGTTSPNEHILAHPLTIPTRFPDVTTVTPDLSPNSSNNNNILNYKIHLSSKRTTTTAMQPAVSPNLKTPPSPLLSPNNNDKSASAVRRIKPTQLLRKNDEAWLQRQRTTTVLSVNDDLIVEPLSATNSPKSQTPIRSNTPQNIRSKSNTPQPISQLSPVAPLRDTSVINLIDSPPVLYQKHPTTIVSPAAGARDLSKLNGEPKLRASQSPTTTKNAVEANAASPTATMDTTVTTTTTNTTTSTSTPPAFEPEYAELIAVCRKADPSSDMEKLIQSKLIKYYFGVHPDFVKSRGFRKNIRNVIERIRTEPELVYFHLKSIVEELKVRRKSKAVVISNDEASTTGSTGNKKTDEQIKKLNRAMYILTKRIEALEEAEVDWDDEDSTYLQVERFKKRACQIYEKICDLTGESKNAHRLVKKPIQFNGTAYPQFNKTLQGFVNRTKEFPDYNDVLRMLEHCNRQYALGLMNFEMKRIAEDAFIKVGKLLQSRRKTDLYETVSHFTANAKDPAVSDPQLLAKLSENQKNQKKISDVIEKFAREQEQALREPKTSDSPQLDSAKSEQDKVNGDEAKEGAVEGKGDADVDGNGNEAVVEKQSAKKQESEDDDDDDDEDTDEEDDEDEENAKELNEDDVETLMNGHLTDESEAEDENNERAKNNMKSPVTTVNAKQVVEKETKTTIDSQKINEELKQKSECDKIDESKSLSSSSDTMRAKTGNLTTETTRNVFNSKSIATAKQQQTNGKLLSNVNNETTMTKTMHQVATHGGASATTMPALKIMSVSSINKSVEVKRNLAHVPGTKTKTVTFVANPLHRTAMATATATSANTTTTKSLTTSLSTKLSTTPKECAMTEIVISDEES